MIKLKDILNETQSKQNINEGKISDTIDLLTSMAKNEVKTNFKELAKFMDLDKIARDLPKVSVRDIESNLVKTVMELKTKETSDGEINEGLSDFIDLIKNKIEDLINNVTKFIQAASRIPGMIKYLKYIKDVKGFMDYYSKNMTTDGVTYKGITNQMVNSVKTDVSEGIFTNNKSITSVFSMMFVVMLMTLTLSGCSTLIAQEKLQDRESNKRQDTTKVVDVNKYKDYKINDPIDHVGGDSPIRPNWDSRTRKELSKTLDRMDREWQGIEKSTRFNMPRTPR